MRFLFIVLLSCLVGVANASEALLVAIENVRATCGGISASLSDLKVKAGIATGASVAGAVTGGVALGAGVAKMGVDDKIEDIQKMFADAIKMELDENIKFERINSSVVDEILVEQDADFSEENLSEYQKKSKQLGNIRTGTLATSAATNIASAVLAGTNRVRGDLRLQIDTCLSAVRTLSNVRMQVRVSGDATDDDLKYAERIVVACEEWSTVDIDKINSRAKGATISSAIGAGMGTAGVATSALANSDNGTDGKSNNLNVASNVLAGGTAAASLTSAILNGTQIKAIKRAATVADECEGALK